MEDFVILPKENDPKNQDTIFNAICEGYKEILLEPGEWKISEEFNVPENIKIELKFDKESKEYAYLSPQKDAMLNFGRGSEIKLQTTDLEEYTIFHLKEDNITVNGATIVGDRDNNEAGGEWGHGILLEGSKNTHINNCHISKCHGDGIYLIDFENLNIINTTVDENRRNGISLIRGKGAQLINCTFSNTRGTAPQSGIDIEPNPNQHGNLVGNLKDIVLKNCISIKNEIAGYNLAAGTTDTGNIKFINCKSFDDNYGFWIYKFKADNVTLDIENCKVYNSKLASYLHEDSNLETTINCLYIHNACSKWEGPQYRRSAFSFYKSENIKSENVQIFNLNPEDGYYGCCLMSNAGTLDLKATVFDEGHYKWVYRNNQNNQTNPNIHFLGNHFLTTKNEMTSEELGFNNNNSNEKLSLMGQTISNKNVDGTLTLDFSSNIQNNFCIGDSYTIALVKDSKVKVIRPKTPEGNSAPEYYYWADTKGSELQILLNENYEWVVVEKTGNF